MNNPKAILTLSNNIPMSNPQVLALDLKWQAAKIGKYLESVDYISTFLFLHIGSFNQLHVPPIFCSILDSQF